MAVQPPPAPAQRDPPPPGVRSLKDLLKKRPEDDACGDCGRASYTEEGVGQLAVCPTDEFHSFEKAAMKLVSSVKSSNKPRRPLEQLRKHLKKVDQSDLEPHHVNFLRRKCRYELYQHVKSRRGALAESMLDEVLPKCKVAEYVCSTYGVFLCEVCARAHKDSDVLNSDVHAIEAVNHDTEILQQMWNGGNVRNHEVWEEYAPAYYAVPPPSYHPRIVTEWIHAKYHKAMFKGEEHAEDFQIRMPQVAMEGFVARQKGKTWEKGFLIHHHRWLSFFKNPTDDVPEQRIDLVGVKVEVLAIESTKRENCCDVLTFQVSWTEDFKKKTKDVAVVFRLERLDEFLRWFHRLKRAEMFYEDPSHLPKQKSDPQVEYLSQLLITNSSCKGTLLKRAKNMRGWVVRWFMILGPTLYYFAKAGENKPLGLINLHNSEVHPRAKQHAANHDHCFALICEERVYVLQAEDEEDRTRWLKELRLCQMLYPRRNKINFAAKEIEQDEAEEKQPELKEIGAI